MKRQLKFALFAIIALAVGTVNAQTTTGDITQQGNATLGSNGTAVKLVDNKGTIKYLQAANGLTSFTNTTPNGGVITTWQLGGTLTSDTYITVNGGNEFALDGLTLQAEGTAPLAVTTPAERTAANQSIHGTAGLGTGWTFLVRDEATGETRKMLATDALQVNSIRVEHTQGTNAAANVDITVAGLPIITAANAGKLFVHRNGVKLRWGTDFTATAAGTLVIVNSEVPMYTGDIVEIQYIR